MQKVEGSNPFSRFFRNRAVARFAPYLKSDGEGPAYVVFGFLPVSAQWGESILGP